MRFYKSRQDFACQPYVHFHITDFSKLSYPASVPRPVVPAPNWSLPSQSDSYKKSLWKVRSSSSAAESLSCPLLPASSGNIPMPHKAHAHHSILNKHLSVVRSVDVTTEMNFSKPSVSVALKNLKSRGYITVSKDGYLHLTDEGRKIAESVYERHTLLTDWFLALPDGKHHSWHSSCLPDNLRTHSHRMLVPFSYCVPYWQ